MFHASSASGALKRERLSLCERHQVSQSLEPRRKQRRRHWQWLKWRNQAFPRPLVPNGNSDWSNYPVATASLAA